MGKIFFYKFFSVLIKDIDLYLKKNNKHKEIISKKDKNEYVSQIDKDIDQIIIEKINKEFPEHNLLTEESGFIEKSSDFTWYIDPIDNTVDLINYKDLYCVSVCLKEKEKYLASFIYFPERDEFYFAYKNTAYLNDKRIKVTNVKLDEKIKAISTCVYVNPKTLEMQTKILSYLYAKKHPLRISGSAAHDLALIASGKHIAHISMGAHDWDIMAGLHLVYAAGGEIKILSERENFVKSFIASSSIKSLNILEQSIFHE